MLPERPAAGRGIQCPGMKSILSWIVLGILLGLLLLGAATFDRSTWPSLVGDEATYLMQAESLAWDFDLTYTRADYDRFVAHWGVKPDGLILQSRNGGKSLSYGKPAFYSFYLAPFVRLAPTRGHALANALLLILTALIATRTLRQALGDAAPLWVACFVFASVAFANVFWAHADLFLMCLTGIAFALAYDGRQVRKSELRDIFEDATTEPVRTFTLRWLTVGACLAAVSLSRPFYAAFFLPALLSVPWGRRRRGILTLAAGALAVGGLSVSSSLALHGSWTSYGGERLGFYGYTGFPEVEIPSGSWPELVAKRGNGSWVAAEKLLPYGFEPKLTAWNALYFLVGRHIGILPYFAPLLLALLAYRAENGRWALLLAAALAMAGFFFVRPMNIYGGGAALANRYFLPVYGALWFLAARPKGVIPPLALVVVAAPFLSPLWLGARSFPLAAGGGFGYVSSWAREFLPYETTQEQLKPTGQEDVIQSGLWIKPLSPGLKVEADGKWLAAAPEATAELLFGKKTGLETVQVVFAPGGPSTLLVQGGTVLDTTFQPDGASTFEVRLGEPRSDHPMWWTAEDFPLYQLRLRLPERLNGAKVPYRFRLEPG